MSNDTEYDEKFSQTAKRMKEMSVSKDNKHDGVRGMDSTTNHDVRHAHFDANESQTQGRGDNGHVHDSMKRGEIVNEIRSYNHKDIRHENRDNQMENNVDNHHMIDRGYGGTDSGVPERQMADSSIFIESNRRQGEYDKSKIESEYYTGRKKEPQDSLDELKKSMSHAAYKDPHVVQSMDHYQLFRRK